MQKRWIWRHIWTLFSHDESLISLGSLSRPRLNFAPPRTLLTRRERQHTEKCIDGISMGNGFLITSQINMSAVYLVALFVFWILTVRSGTSTAWPDCSFSFPSCPRWGKPNLHRSPFPFVSRRPALTPDVTQRISCWTQNPPKSNIFPIRTLKSLSWSKWSHCLNRASVGILLRTVKEACFPSVQARFIFLHS